MAFDYINEAFKRLDTLEEDIFKSSYEGINKLSEFVKEDNEVDETVRVIDPNADDAEALEDSYVGKVIINCNVCHSHIFENKDEITIDEDGAVNVEMQCPYCGESEGFVIIGEIAPYGDSKEDDSVEEEPTVEEETPVEEDSINTEDNTSIEESLDDDKNISVKRSKFTERLMTEDFKEVSIKTEDQMLEMSSDENGKVTVTTEPITSEDTMSAEAIVPVSAETEADILANNDVEESTDETTEDTADESEESTEETEMSFDEADEEGLDELGESYFKRVYENVNSFKTTDISATPTQLIVEGVIEFNSGAQKKTGFIFEAKDMNSKGQLRFVGTNKHLTEATDAFCLVGRIDNKKLFVESLKYNYSISDSAVRGLVRRK